MAIKDRGHSRYDVELRGKHVKRVDDPKVAAMLEMTGKRLLALGKPLPEVIAELRGGHKATVPTFRTYSQAWLSELTCEAASKTVYRNALNLAAPILGDMELDAIDHAALKRVAVSLTRTHSSATVKKVLTVAKSVLHDACDEGVIATRPPRKVKQAPKPKPVRPGFALTREQHDLIVAAASERSRDMFALWPWVGLRLGEMLALRHSDFDLQARKLYVTRQLRIDGQFAPPKGGRSRDVDLADPAIEILARIPQAAVLFPSDTEGYLARRTVSAWVAKAGLASGVKLHSHIFRHTCGSWLIESGAPLTYVARFLGDTVEVVMRTYLHEIEAADSRGIMALNEFANRGHDGDGE